jgi:SAM-dependent methyltransferase
MAFLLRRYLRLAHTALKLAKLIESPAYSEFSGVYPIHFPALDIEVEATQEHFSQLIARIEQSWTHLGEVRPHYSVITQREFLPANIPNSIDSFWASGKSEADTAAFLLRKLGFGELSGRTCVEYGCGIGRVTIPLATKCAEIHAYDISKSHLALARQRADSLRVNNVSFHHCGGSLPRPFQRCDLFYSRLVFQHNPPPIIRELIRLGLDSLRTGGVAIFGVPVYLSDYSFRIDEYLKNPPTAGMEMHCFPQREVFALISAAECSVVEVREERTIAVPASWCLGNIFVVQRQSSALLSHGPASGEIP